MKITDALVMEHGAMRVLFEEIERVWPHIRTIDETALLARILEGLLTRHGGKEENLLYAAYDHVLEEKGQLERMNQEHDELDERLFRVHQAATLPEAKRLLQEVLARTRKHFQFEEQSVFPAIEQTVEGETLEKLAGSTWQAA